MSKKLELYLYKKGTARQCAVENRKTFGKLDYGDAYERALRNVRPEQELTLEDDVAVLRLWQNYLVRFGGDLDKKVDELFTEVITCGDSWRDDKKKINAVLDCLLRHRFSIRNFEEEVQDFILNVTSRSGIIDGFASVPAQVLSELHSTYSRTFDICALKLNSINSGRITATNIALSVVALIVAVLSLLVALK